MFEENLIAFTEALLNHITEDMKMFRKIKTFLVAANKMPGIINSDIQALATELQSLFDHAVLSKLEDLHLGNVGFKKMPDGKNPEGSWRLVFTDIDS